MNARGLSVIHFWQRKIFAACVVLPVQKILDWEIDCLSRVMVFVEPVYNHQVSRAHRILSRDVKIVFFSEIDYRFLKIDFLSIIVTSLL